MILFPELEMECISEDDNLNFIEAVLLEIVRHLESTEIEIIEIPQIHLQTSETHLTRRIYEDTLRSLVAVIEV